MRILFCSTGGSGHTLPMLPLAQACSRESHDIAWATSRDAQPTLRECGIPVWEAGVTAAECRAEYRARWPEHVTLTGRELAAHAFPKLFGAVAAYHMVDGLSRAVEAWAPDLVVNEVAALAAPLVCQRLEVKHVAHAYGLMVPAAALAAAAQELQPLWAMRGGSAPRDCGLFTHLYIDVAPPSLQTQDLRIVPRFQLSRPGAAPQGQVHVRDARLAPFLEEHASGKLLYLTFGTVLNRHRLLREAAIALSSLGVPVVISVGNDGDTQLLDQQPKHVFVTRYVPQHELLPLCTAVVSHGGSGTVLAAASHGLAQMLLPQMADQFRNADAFGHAGAALSMVNDIDVQSIAIAARSLLESTSHREAAQRLALEIAGMPPLAEVVRRLESLA